MVVDRLEGERQVQDRRRCQDQDVVHQCDGLVVGDVRTGLVDDCDESGDAHLEGGRVAEVFVQYVDRHARSVGAHVEQAGRRCEELVLRRGGAHPRRRRGAAHLGVELDAQVAHAGSPDCADPAEVGLQQCREVGEVVLGDHRRERQRMSQECPSVALESGAETAGSGVAHPRQQPAGREERDDGSDDDRDASDQPRRGGARRRPACRPGVSGW